MILSRTSTSHRLMEVLVVAQWIFQIHEGWGARWYITDKKFLKGQIYGQIVIVHLGFWEIVSPGDSWGTSLMIVCVSTHIYVSVHIYIHICIYTYSCIHIYINMYKYIGLPSLMAYLNRRHKRRKWPNSLHTVSCFCLALIYTPHLLFFSGYT